MAKRMRMRMKMRKNKIAIGARRVRRVDLDSIPAMQSPRFRSVQCCRATEFEMLGSDTFDVFLLLLPSPDLPHDLLLLFLMHLA